MRRQVPHTKDTDTRSRQLKRQRDAVEPAANFQNRRHIGVGEGEPIHRRAGALVEQLDGRVTQRIAGRETDRIRWKFQSGQAMQRLTLCPQRLAARCQNADIGRRLQHRLGHCRRRPDNVLATVEHDQGSFVAQPRGQSRQGIGRRRMDSKRRAKGARHQVGIRQGGQPDKPNSVPVTATHGLRDRDRDCGFANPAGAYDGKEAAAGQLCPQRGDNIVAPNNAHERRGEIVGFSSFVR